MAVTITVRTPPAVTPGQLQDERVGVIGVTNGTGVVGTLYDVGGGENDLTAAVAGATSEPWAVIEAIRAQVNAFTTLSPLAASPTATTVGTALDRFLDVTPPVTMVVAAGDVGSTATLAAAINTWCQGRQIRGMVSAPVGASPANVTAAANAAAAFTAGYNHLIATFGAPANEFPVGPVAAAVLRSTRDNGRQHGVEGIPVVLDGSLRWPMTALSPAAQILDTANVMTVVASPTGGHTILGGKFEYTDPNDIRSNFAIARVLDHVIYLIRLTWAGLVGSTRSLPDLAVRLELGLTPLVGSEIASVSITPNAAGSARGLKSFVATVGFVHPAEDLTMILNMEENTTVTLA